MKNILAALCVMALCVLIPQKTEAQTVEWLNCNSLRLGLTNGGNGVCTNCYGPLPSLNKMFARFDIWELNENGNRSRFIRTLTTPYSPTKVIYGSASYLEEGVDYEVDAFFAFLLDGICQTTPVTPIGGCVGGWVFSGTTETFSFGSIEHNWAVNDESGIDDNSIFCTGDIQGGGPFLTGGLEGEQQWKIDICLVNPSNSSNCNVWTSTYWQSGPMPSSVDLLNDVWRKWHPSWAFWPNNTYRVNVVGRKDNCTGWDSQTYTFTVLSNFCRTGSLAEKDISLFPNPTKDFLHIKGLSVLETQLDYKIIDISGRTVGQGSISDPNDKISVKSLNSGIYFMQIGEGEAQINKRFTVL